MEKIGTYIIIETKENDILQSKVAIPKIRTIPHASRTRSINDRLDTINWYTNTILVFIKRSAFFIPKIGLNALNLNSLHDIEEAYVGYYFGSFHITNEDMDIIHELDQEECILNNYK